MTALLASTVMGQVAKRSARANVLINVGGALLFLLFTYVLAELVTTISDNAGIAVAIAHLLFNAGVAIVALPLVRPLANWLQKSRRQT